MRGNSTRIAASCYAPRSHLPLHARPVSYLSLVMSGSYVERVGRENIHCRALSLRFHPAGEEHRHEFGLSGGRCLTLEIDEAWNESLRSLLSASRPVHVRSTAGVGLQLIERFLRDEKHDRQLADSFISELLSLCEREVRIERAVASSKSIRRVIEIIEDDFARELPLTKIAEAVGLHPTHLARSFRSATGMTIGEYVRRRRRERAETLLMDQPKRGISRIAAESGFADHAHMTRTFRADLGVPPSQYRTSLLSP